MIDNILDFGNELEISGMIMQNSLRGTLVLFPDSPVLSHYDHLRPTHEEMKELLYQLDTLGVQTLQKTVLRKSQRQIEQSISWNVFRRDKYTCRYCGANDVPLTVDHVVLWEHMGASEEDNLTSACRKCNKTRGNMLYPDWLKSDYYLKVIAHDTTNVLHTWNLKQWELAQKVPLRPTQRNR